MKKTIVRIAISFILPLAPALACAWTYKLDVLPNHPEKKYPGLSGARMNDSGWITGNGYVSGYGTTCTLSDALLWTSLSSSPTILHSGYMNNQGCWAGYGGAINNAPSPLVIAHTYYNNFWAWSSWSHYWRNGKLTDAEWPFHNYSIASANDSDWTVGSYNGHRGPWRAVVQGPDFLLPSGELNPDASRTILCAECPETMNIGATAINNKNEVAGNLDLDGFIWDATRGIRTMNCGGNETMAQVHDFNDLGQAVGSWTDWSGKLGFPDGTQAFIWEEGVGCRAISLAMMFNAINDRGQAVGVGRDRGTHQYVDVGQVWDQGLALQKPLDLAPLVPDLPVGWSIREALDINNPGQIVARCVDDSGAPQACVLTPVPNYTIKTASWSSSRKALSVTAISPDNAQANLWLWTDSNNMRYRKKMNYDATKNIWRTTVTGVTSKPATVTTYGNAGPVVKAVTGYTR